MVHNVIEKVNPLDDRGRPIALLVLAGVMLMICFAVMGDRPVKQGDLAATQPVTYRINVNQADRDALTLLPGIAQGKAQRVIDTRKILGPFQQTRDLIQVPMIGEKTAAALDPWVCFE